ncbi:MAG: hypothetical protein NT049_10050 [Planctomycetota bacterium]|nr:hypothetical protein [Planctomycetota bacterium]
MKESNFSLARSAQAALALAALTLVAVSAGCQMEALQQQPQAQRKLTVLLAEYRGPTATAEAIRVGQELSGKGLRDVFVVEGAGMASLCVGHFNSWQDKNADETLKFIRRTSDSAGQFPFAGVMLVPIPEATPQNPWPLEDAKGVFTLHIASWEAPGRMQKAQAYAAELRTQGYEAYVYHGPRLSMVTLGAYGPEIFDNPALVGQPGAKPKITSPKLLELIQKFPRMRLEGEVVPPEAHVPTQLVKVPGREAPAGNAAVLPKVLYRVTLTLVDTKTGQAEGRNQAAGVAQSSTREEISRLVAALVKQLAGAIPEGRPARVGIAGVMAADANAARDRADVTALEAVVAAVGRLPQDKAVVFGVDATRQYLDAAGLAPKTVMTDPRPLKGVQAFDFVITGSVTSFSR